MVIIILSNPYIWTALVVYYARKEKKYKSTDIHQEVGLNISLLLSLMFFRVFFVG